MHFGTLLHHRTMRRWWNQASHCVHCATGAVMSHQCSVFYRTQIVSLRPRQFQGRSCSHDNNSLQWSITAINRQSIMQLIYMNSNVKMELDMQLQCPAASNVLRTVRTSPVRLTSATTTFAFSHSPRQYENTRFFIENQNEKTNFADEDKSNESEMCQVLLDSVFVYSFDFHWILVHSRLSMPCEPARKPSDTLLSKYIAIDSTAHFFHSFENIEFPGEFVCMRRTTTGNRMSEGNFMEAIAPVLVMAQCFAIMPVVGVNGATASEFHGKRCARFTV